MSIPDINETLNNPHNNTPLLQERNITICVNTFCSNTKEFSLTTERCPDCKKLLSKVVKGESPQYVSCFPIVGDSISQVLESIPEKVLDKI
jgi:hypothetical protein